MKKNLIYGLFTFMLFFIAAFHPQAALSRSYSVDEINIRAWIQPNGDVLVNEIFNYTLNGSCRSAFRVIHVHGHEGVDQFEAYELLKSNAELGFVNPAELQRLTLSQIHCRSGKRTHHGECCSSLVPL
ncbi:hypothetical protein [Jeotgalibacillus soli]|uniref:Uncharacterized protein n=1 Tax=Jeotgalibacillus soli TaxID=889306 RepID=A0A0C2SCW9_9BACL|nr:hypothetical protein [Jeotgalibacillus soli]KIL51819.1 hypothetical protein KP78_01890 [Jeotgalibacillus soli]